MEDLDQVAVDNFRAYLKIPSVQPNVNYDVCVSFLEDQANSLGLPVRIYYFCPNAPVVIITWIGTKPELPSIMLNGHMDVVPVFRDEWTHDPFAAEIDDKGNIYARGTQDMKCVSIQYLEAIRRLKKENVKLIRTIHVSFIPDEEIGGLGMKAFSEAEEFKKLNVGFALDEGMASVDNVIPLFYGERTGRSMRVHCSGQPGHGSLLLDNTAGEKARKILHKFYEFREQEKKKLENDPNLTPGDVTTVNLTIMQGGVQSNVIPSDFILSIDCRVALSVNLKEFEETLDEWCKEAGEGVWIEYSMKGPHVPETKLDESNPYWISFKRASDEMNLCIKPQIFPAGTDSRYLRAMNISALGFSPMPNTPVLLHDRDEYLNKNVFLRGVEIYRQLITAIANTK